jgi:DUF4097 and DUF4098 domain-containing protein YvlB
MSSGKRFSALLGVASAAVLAAACDVSVDAQGFTTRDEKTFTVSGTPDVTLATFDGAIEIRSWDQPEVKVEIERRAQTREEAESIEIKAEQNGTHVTVEVRQPSQHEHRIGFGFHVSRSARLIATVPRRSNVLARSGDGAIHAERIEGRVELRTADGKVTADELKGQLRIHTSDGNVTLTNVDGAIDLDTADGSITLDGRLTAVRVKSGDGRIAVRAANGSAMTGDWDISTSDGSIDVDLPGSFNADIDAHTSDGSIDISGLTLATSGEIRRDTVRGTLGRGGARVRLRSGDGSIRLRGAQPAERTDQK